MRASSNNSSRFHSSRALLLLALAAAVLASGCAVTNSALPELPPVRTLSLTPRSLPDAFQNSPYPSQFLATVGGVPPLSSCTAVSGTFPAGLEVLVNPANATQCVIRTPLPLGVVTQEPGTYRFTIRAADSVPTTATQEYEITVVPGFAINPFTLENGTEGRAFSQVITTSLGGGRGVPPLLADPNGCMATGLPAGLSISRNPADTSGCIISGTPAAGSAGMYGVRVTLRDSANPTNVRSFPSDFDPMITIPLVINAPLVMNAFALANGTEGRPFGDAVGGPFVVTTTGGQIPLSSCADGGTLPAGLVVAISMDGRNCEISGTPTVNGNFNVTISATDTATATTGTGTVMQSAMLAVNAPLDITSLALANGTVGQPYSGQLTNSGGQTPFTWTNPGGDLAAGACAGLTVNAAGMVTGTPTTPGTCVFTARVDDTATTTTAAGSDQDSVTIIINDALVITTLTFENGTAGRAFNAQLLSTGGNAPLTWTNPGGDIAAGACAGLTLSAAGAIGGTPTTAGTCVFTARVDDTASATTPATFDQQSITIEINAALAITSLTLGNGIVGTAFSQALTHTGGQTPFTWSNPGGDLAAGACAGLTINAAGLVSGVPTTAGTCVFTARVDDTATATTAAGFDQQSVTVVINAPLVITTDPMLPDGVVNRAYSFMLANTGGEPPFTWSDASGNLGAGACAGLGIDAGGTVSGTPTTAGTCTFTARVTSTATASTPSIFTDQVITIEVRAALAVTLVQAGNATPNAALFDGILGRSYGEIGATPTWSVTGGLGSYTWCVFSGTTPGGMVGISTDCGAPTAAGSVTLTSPAITGATGVFIFSVRVFDSANAATAQGFATSPTLLNIEPEISASINAGTVVSPTAVTLPDAVEGRTYGAAGPDPTRVDFVSTFSGGFGPPYPNVFFSDVDLPSLPTPFNCFNLAAGTITCHTSGLPIDVGGAAVSPFSFSGNFGDNGNPAVPPFTLTVVYTLNTRTGLALAANMVPPDAVQGRSYGADPLTPLIYTASGGLSFAGATFTVPTGFAAPGLGFPEGIACAQNVLDLTCAAPVSVTGTPGIYGPFSVVVDDAGNETTPGSAISGTSGGVGVTLNVNAPLTIPAVALANGTQDRLFGPVNFPFAGGLTGFACAGAGLPAGMTVPAAPVASACQLNNTPTVNGAFTPSVSVTDVANASTPAGAASTGPMPLTINAPLAITTVDPLAGAVSGAAYNFTFTNSGGQTPFTWSTPGGDATSLNTADPDCAGLSMDSAGNITGTPTAAAGGTCTFTARVDDTATATTAAGFDDGVFNIAIVDQLTVVAFTPVGNGTVGRAFSQVVSVVGGDGTLRTDPNGCTLAPGSGALPNGLTFVRNPGNTNTCLLSGTPTVAGTFSNITVRISDQPGSTADFGPFDIVINAALNLAAFTLQNGTEDRPYGDGLGGPFQIAITGGEAPYTCDDPTDSLPVGVVVAAVGTNCEISGTPALGSSAGDYTVNIRVQDSATSTTAAGSDNETSAQMTIAVPLAFDDGAALPDAVAGRTYTLSLSVSGGQPAYTFSQVAGMTLADDPECAGLTFNAAGDIGGTPTTDGTCTFTVRVDDTATANSAAGFEEMAFTIVVQPELTIGTTTLPNARRTSAYFPTGLPGAEIVATGGTGTPTTWTVTSGNFTLNAGVWEGNAATPCEGLAITEEGTPLNTVVFGIAFNAGTCTFDIQVSDDGSGPAPGGNDTQTLSILVLNTFAYAGGSGTSTVQVINTDTEMFVQSIAIGGGTNPDQVAVTPDGRVVVVTSPATGEVILIDASTNTQFAGSPFDVSAACTEPRGVATNNLVGIGQRAYIACAATNNVIAIDADPANVGGTLGDVVANIAAIGSATGTPQRIAFNPAGTLAYVTVTTTDEFTVVDATTDAISSGPSGFGAFPCGGPMGIVIAPDGLSGFVACSDFTDGRKVVVIDTDSTSGTFNTAIAHTTTLLGSTGQAQADSIAITPDGARLYVSLGGGFGGLPQMSIVTVATLAVEGVVGDTLGVPFLDGVGPEAGLSANTSPLGVTIPPDALVRIFMVMNGDATGNDPPNTTFAPGAAVFNDGPPVTEGAGNPIAFATGTLPRGIAHIPIPR